MLVQNAEIAAMFDQAAELLEIKGDNPFRTRAYRRAARVIESLPKSAEGMLRAGDDLTELPGIGEDLAGKIAAIVATGKFNLLESLKRELPGSLSELTAIPGLGPKRVKLLQCCEARCYALWNSAWERPCAASKAVRSASCLVCTATS
jgi:DNA polymerase (family 10)